MTPQPPSTSETAAVEAMARAMFTRDYAPMGTDWLAEHQPERWHRELAERALAASERFWRDRIGDELAALRAQLQAVLDLCDEADAHDPGYGHWISTGQIRVLVEARDG